MVRRPWHPIYDWADAIPGEERTYLYASSVPVGAKRFIDKFHGIPAIISRHDCGTIVQVRPEDVRQCTHPGVQHLTTVGSWQKFEAALNDR